MPAEKFYPVKLIRKAMIARDIMELHFAKPSGFTFIPGQFARFQVPVAEDRVLRNYSFSSHADDEYLEFCAKIIPEGKASKFFLELPVGRQAYVSPAKGVFMCRSEHSADKMFIATGAGVAPLMAMVTSELKKSAGARIRLLFGVRAPEDVFWKERLEHLAGAYPQFDFTLTASRPNGAWVGHSGRVTAHLPRLMLRAADYYVCGSVEMVKDVRSLLLHHGADTKSIHLEIF